MTNIHALLGNLRKTFARKSPEVEPETIAVPRWHDDTLLRDLSDDFEAGRTNLNLAADMSSLFKLLDAYNEGKPPEERVSIVISNTIANEIARTPYIENPDYLGLDFIATQDMAFERNGQKTFAFYSASSEDFVNINVHTGSQGWQPIDFDLDDPFQGAFEHTAATLARGVTREPS